MTSGGCRDGRRGQVVRVVGRIFWGGSKNLMQEKNEEGHVKIEVGPEGCAYELC